jgi:hypothetical protein
MEKRYQVFVSSTFADLKDERQEVLRAILELGHMPAGMELFPATDATAWQLIKDVIDASDYYVVIVSGRYGSVDEAGLGFTEREYDYAVERGKPVIALLHQSPGDIPRDKTDKDETAWKKLEAFRSKVEKKHTCQYWKGPEDLKSKSIISILDTTRRKPGVGWVRSDRVPDDATLADILRLQAHVAELEKEIAERGSEQPKGADRLAQGDDTFQVHYDYVAVTPDPKNPYARLSQPWEGWSSVTWDEVFGAIAPTMITEASDYDVRQAITKYFLQRANEEQQQDEAHKDAHLQSFQFKDDEIETVIVQCRALGLIEESIKPRSVKDTRTFWRLTKYGDKLMTTLRAIRREPPSDRLVVEAVLEPKNEKK